MVWHIELVCVDFVVVQVVEKKLALRWDILRSEKSNPHITINLNHLRLNVEVSLAVIGKASFVSLAGGVNHIIGVKIE